MIGMYRGSLPIKEGCISEVGFYWYTCNMAGQCITNLPYVTAVQGMSGKLFNFIFFYLWGLILVVVVAQWDNSWW